jgi:hypothetical protein
LLVNTYCTWLIMETLGSLIVRHVPSFFPSFCLFALRYFIWPTTFWQLMGQLKYRRQCGYWHGSKSEQNFIKNTKMIMYEMKGCPKKLSKYHFALALGFGFSYILYLNNNSLFTLFYTLNLWILKITTQHF